MPLPSQYASTEDKKRVKELADRLLRAEYFSCDDSDVHFLVILSNLIQCESEVDWSVVMDVESRLTRLLAIHWQWYETLTDEQRNSLPENNHSRRWRESTLGIVFCNHREISRDEHDLLMKQVQDS